MKDSNKKVKDVTMKVFSRFKDIKFNIIVVAVLMIGILSGATIKTTVVHRKHTEAYEVTFGEEKIGYVRDKSTVLDIYDDIKTKAHDKYGLKITVDKEFKFLETHVEDEELISKIQLRDSIKSNLGYNVWAYVLSIDGRELVFLESEEQAKNIIKDIKQPYIEKMEKEDSKIEEVKIVEDININRVKAKASQVKDYDKALKILQKGTDEEKIHKVENGESFWSIANKYNITVEELAKANPSKNPELIQPGDKLSLIVPKPYLTVATYETKTFKEKVPYDTEYEKTNGLYADETRIKRSGKEGVKEVVAKVEKRNGIEVAKKIISETIKSQPISQVIIKGTKKIPATRGTGVFKRPVGGIITSPYGPRWGSFHSGIDIGARTGTPIKAADGGVVTYSGWRGNYGYLVEIDHGGGFKTRYAHCSRIYVKTGERVYKDKTIAAVGNTGRSTGPHLHFEVIKYGNTKNPSNYINKKYR